MGRHRKEQPKRIFRVIARGVTKRAVRAVLTALISYVVREGLDQALNREDGPLSHHEHGAEGR
ncbi:hypothetical protein GCM10010315_18240 [Streptomyces luteosporeus]|uniref:Histone H2A n=1 Tax=Streptomyces luteosporeus TaxID=173856 RepID=A0ABN3TNS0_9ACTN